MNRAHNLKRYGLASILLHGLFLLNAQNDWNKDLTKEIQNLFEHQLLRHALISSSVRDVESGNEIFNLNGHKTLIPASSQKLIPTLIALDVLGSDFRFKTTIAYSGEILRDGTLTGDLIIFGDGDPCLGSRKFEDGLSFQELLNHVGQVTNEAGINCIDGGIVVDAAAYEDLPVGHSWQYNDLGNYYAAGVWGINVNDNEYTIYFGPRGSEGSKTRVTHYEPAIPGLILQNEVLTGPEGSGDQAYIFGAPQQYYRKIIGTIPPGPKEFSIRGSIPDPPYFFAYQLSQMLDEIGIAHDAHKVIYRRDERATTVQELNIINSVSLSDYIAYANFQSDNMITDAILKVLGRSSSEPSSLEAGISFILDYLEGRQIELWGLHLEDGSGLSHRNRISASFMSYFLKHMWIEELGEEVLQFLPMAGSQGTVRGILSDEQDIDVWLKSGSMGGILSYSGYLRAAAGDWLSFCLIINGFSCNSSELKPLIDEYLHSIYQLNGIKEK